MRSISSIIFLILLICFDKQSCAQLKTHSFSEVDSLSITTNKNTLVFIHADWCKYCNLMKSTVFSDEEVIQILNDKYLFNSFNAESKDDITFQNHIFKFKPTGTNTGVHELAEQLGTVNNELNFPAICILNSEFEIIFQYNGLLTKEELIQILTKISE